MGDPRQMRDLVKDLRLPLVDPQEPERVMSNIKREIEESKEVKPYERDQKVLKRKQDIQKMQQLLLQAQGHAGIG